MALISGLLNIEIELYNIVESVDEYGTPQKGEPLFWKRKKATHSNPPVSSNVFAENENRYIIYTDIFTIRYDEEVNYKMLLKYNNSFYRINTINVIERKKHLIVNCVKIENNNYGV